MAAQPYPLGTFPTQFFGGGISRSIYTPNSTGGPYNKFTGGTIFAGGPLQNNDLFDATFGVLGYPYLGVGNKYNDNKPNLDTTANGALYGVTKATSAGTFASMVAGQYVLLTFNSQLAGVATTVLRSPGSSYTKGTNYNIGWVDTVQVNRGGGFYMQNGLPIAPKNSRDNIKTDPHAGSRSNPGTLTYWIGSKTATVDSYKARTD